MTPTDRMQTAFARLVGDADARARFLRDPQAESVALAELAPEAVAAYADGVLAKRYREVRASLPRSARAASFRAAFVAYAARVPVGGRDRHRRDAIAFARTLGTPVARAERLALEASRDRRFVAVALDGATLRWWVRPAARARLRAGRFGGAAR